MPAVLHLSVSISYCCCGCSGVPAHTNIHLCSKENLKCTLKYKDKLSYSPLEQASSKGITSFQNKEKFSGLYHKCYQKFEWWYSTNTQTSSKICLEKSDIALQMNAFFQLLAGEKERIQKEQEMIHRAQEKEKVWETSNYFCICWFTTVIKSFIWSHCST